MCFYAYRARLDAERGSLTVYYAMVFVSIAFFSNIIFLYDYMAIWLYVYVCIGRGLKPRGARCRVGTETEWDLIPGEARWRSGAKYVIYVCMICSIFGNSLSFVLMVFSLCFRCF